jgi:pimeloyl-ACP methyl ester carboxylesterase
MSEETAAAFAAIPSRTGPTARRCANTSSRSSGLPRALSPLDEDAIREVAGRMFDRTENIASALTNHDLIDSGDSPARQLDVLPMPVLVAHGTDDPSFPMSTGSRWPGRSPTRIS